ncbi:NADH-dependent flavin oxidoreductase [Jeotgalibaca caeni]|uniref:NADH-dependent flavin oxidoreductase n=1 Tax=Jeotgalibaca caeni TaxID=3028623 RepID=UPI00237EBD66|nr:NADH-dependent flavin oxidoreductase [Jeotgalibaca caeni]MDE1549550.1 NADH-dependent flavin oxidoreductase [Jeotgalibaca caeni]
MTEREKEKEMNQTKEQLFQPFIFPNGGTIENRIVLAPMTTNSSFINGMLTTDELNYYARRSKGLGAVITSCAHVMENGRFAASLSAASDAMIPSLKKLANTIHQSGTKAILQIFHVGRMGSRATLKAEQPVSASAVAPLRKDAEEPRALSAEEVAELVIAYGEATRRAIEAGFDGVELHGANTYLIQQFFSPHSNRREDEWGGSVEKRMAFLLAVVEAAQNVVREHAKEPFILGYRISPEELEEPGITMEDTLQLLNRLKKEGLDYIHVSLGHYQQTSMRDKEAKTPVLSQILTAIGDDIPVIGVGQVETEEDAATVLEMGAPIVAIGRKLIVEPDWIEKAKSGEEMRTVLKEEDREELAIPDMMWEYMKSRPGWLPFEN